MIRKLWDKFKKRLVLSEQDEEVQVTVEPSEESSSEEKLWDVLVTDTCPDCKTDKTLGVVATGGIAFNVRCFSCNSLFWMTPERYFGAKKML